MTSITIIEGMLAPGIMISACGLLLLGMNNKYSLVVSRIRQLNTEFRELSDHESDRKTSIETQIPLLSQRVKLIKNTVWLYTMAVAMFILSILSIGINFLTDSTEISSTFALIFFILAILFVLFGIFHAANEVRLGYKIVRIETYDSLNFHHKNV